MTKQALNSQPESEILDCQLAIIGGGTGGFAAAWAALRQGLKVVITDSCDRLGGQFTSQAVPPDEHPWIESHGSTRSYRQFRQYIRSYYRQWYPLSNEAAQNWQKLNPGQGCVSALCHEPSVSSAVIEALLRPYLSSGQLNVILRATPIQAERQQDKIISVLIAQKEAESSTYLNCAPKIYKNRRLYSVRAPYFIDATETGDLLPLTQTAYSIGSESQTETQEPHAPPTANPQNQQAISWCFVIDYQPQRESIIDKPANYEFWRSYIPAVNPSWGGPLLSWQATHPITLEPVVRTFDPINPQPERGPMDLWTFRRISYTQNFRYAPHTSDIVLVNWPQIDYMLGNIIDVSEQEKNRHLAGSRELSLSLLYWMQTEAPRADGGQGWPGLALRPDITQTADGLAAAPYIRESRRIKGLFTVLEQHVSLEARCALTGLKAPAVKAANFSDSVGIGAYRLDLHPSSGGDNYIDVSALPFQIPLGALIPRDTDNLLAGGKNLSVTHITNGCYRLHPVEWNTGESAALCAAYCLAENLRPTEIRKNSEVLRKFQNWLMKQGIELEWTGKTYPL
ncbi:MAG: FAD-dependent oxidoreductase [Candidatus Bruticola sp.]